MLSSSGKKILLSVHILLISVWLGSALVILLLSISRHAFPYMADYHLLDKIIFYVYDVVLMNAAIAVLLSGMIFSLFTPWGFFRFYWIIMKWAGVMLPAGIMVFLQSPSINGMAALSDVYRETIQTLPEYEIYSERNILYTAIQLVFLVIIVIISVFKPWGQRKSRRIWNRKWVVFSGVVVSLLLILSMILQYLQLQHYRHLDIEAVDLKQLQDDYYVGRADFGFEYEVGVFIENHRIKDIKILNNRPSFYARLAEGITTKILREQKTNPDAVTGATTTSKALLKAVESALKNSQTQRNRFHGND